MIRALYTAASGMMLGLRTQDAVAENLANTNTVGFKADRVSQSEFGGVLARSIEPTQGPVQGLSERVIGKVGGGAYIGTRSIYMAAGSERETGNRLDMMIKGDGFFVVETEDGVRYTRDGHMERDETGRLVNADGAPILDVNNNPITLEDDEIRVTLDGRLERDIFTEVTLPDGSTMIETTQQLVARLQIVNVNTDDLIRARDSLFEAKPGAAVTQFIVGTDVQILQGSLEESNVNVQEVASQLMNVARSFETNQRVFTEINKTLDYAVRSIGKV